MMKYHIYILLCLTVLSCSKEKESRLINEWNLSINGRYAISSLEWDGDGIDLNNDGVASSDLIEEYRHFRNWQELSFSACKVKLIEEIGHYYSLTIKLPIQHITMNSHDDSFQLDENGYGGVHLLLFRLNKKGELDIKKEEEDIITVIPESEKYSANYASCGGTEIILMKDGIIKFATNCYLYDYSSNGFVTGKMTGTLTREKSYL